MPGHQASGYASVRSCALHATRCQSIHAAIAQRHTHTQILGVDWVKRASQRRRMATTNGRRATVSAASFATSKGRKYVPSPCAEVNARTNMSTSGDRVPTLPIRLALHHSRPIVPKYHMQHASATQCHLRPQMSSRAVEQAFRRPTCAPQTCCRWAIKQNEAAKCHDAQATPAPPHNSTPPGNIVLAIVAGLHPP